VMEYIAALYHIFLLHGGSMQTKNKGNAAAGRNQPKNNQKSAVADEKKGKRMSRQEIK